MFVCVLGFGQCLCVCSGCSTNIVGFRRPATRTGFRNRGVPTITSRQTVATRRARGKPCPSWTMFSVGDVISVPPSVFGAEHTSCTVEEVLKNHVVLYFKSDNSTVKVDVKQAKILVTPLPTNSP